MNGKEFKSLCKKCLNLEANGFGGEMPDDWKVNIATALGEEDILWQDDTHGERKMTFLGVSMNGHKEDALKHFTTKELLKEIEKRNEEYWKSVKNC